MTFDLSGVRVGFDGLHADHAERLQATWNAFRAPADGAAVDLLLEVRYGDAEVPSIFRPKAMRFEAIESGARFTMEQGHVDVATAGRATITLAGTAGGEAWFALMNFVRAALAWTLPARPAGLVHAAGAVVDGVGWLLVGGEGSGKSTWARSAESGGARVVSDDLVLIDRDAGGWQLCDAPFHSTHRIEHRPGRWPLAGLLFPRHGSRAALDPVAGLTTKVHWLANLPFLDQAIDAPHVAGLLAVTDEVACHRLTFAPDPSWLEQLR